MHRFLLLVLALNAWACARRNDEPTPEPASGTCSYVLDGRATTGTATAVRNPTYHVLDAAGDHAAELLTITCVGTVAANAAPEKFSLDFIKLATEPDAAFRMLPSPGIDVLRYNPATGSDYTNYVLGANLTVKKTATGGFSGTFSGAYPATANTGQSTFKSGVFTDVHP
ncbi:hypothetical protein AXW84_17770 [Hymenobacter sp. PAMC 26628]|nr:hypothetical protein AXW84_17770 [Hymenobacter sp. PAMC 26628]